MGAPRAARVLVTGATGRLGREVVRMARARGHEVRALSRQPARGDGTVAADLVSGEGLSAALAGVDVVVHAASDPRPGGRTDAEGTRRLVEAAGEAGVSHLLLVSIVGVDRIPFEYTPGRWRRSGSSPKVRCRTPSSVRRSSTSSWTRC